MIFGDFVIFFDNYLQNHKNLDWWNEMKIAKYQEIIDKWPKFLVHVHDFWWADGGNGNKNDEGEWLQIKWK